MKVFLLPGQRIEQVRARFMRKPRLTKKRIAGLAVLARLPEETMMIAFLVAGLPRSDREQLRAAIAYVRDLGKWSEAKETKR